MAIDDKLKFVSAIFKLVFYLCVAMVCLGISILGFTYFFSSGQKEKETDSVTATTTNAHDEIENLANSAESKVRHEWRFSDYAQTRMPAEMASGEWASGRNIWDCNLKEFDCIEVDFRIPSHDIKAAWLLSYEKKIHAYYATRPLTQAVNALFEIVPPSQEEVGKLAQAMAKSSEFPNSDEIVPLPGEMIKYIQRHYEMSPELAALYVSSPPPSDGGWFEAPSSEYQQKDICKSRDADCYTVHYSDFKNQVECYWTVAIFRSGSDDQRVYPSDDARKWYRPISNPISVPLQLK